MLEFVKKNFERGVLTLLGVALVSVIGFFAWFFPLGKQIFSADIAQWGQFGDYFGGTLNPIIGLVTAYFAYSAFKATRSSLEIAQATAQHALLSTTLESFYKIFDSKVNSIKYYRESSNSVTEIFEGKDALICIAQDIESFIKDEFYWDFIFAEDAGQSLERNFKLKVTQVHSLIGMVRPLLDSLEAENNKIKFSRVIKQYFDVQLLIIIKILSQEKVIAKYSSSDLGILLNEICFVNFLIQPNSVKT